MPRFAVQNAGRLISRGHGCHVSRVISSWELIFVLESTLAMFAGEENYDVNAGSCLLLAPGIRHGGRTPYDPRLSFFWIHFLPSDAASERFLREMPRCFSVSNPARLSEYFHLFLSLQEEAPEDQTGLDLIFELIFHEARRHAENPAGKEAELPGLLRRLQRILTLRFREPLSTSLLAKELQCSPDYLGRLCRMHLHTSVTEMLNEIRLRHAAALLADTSLNVMQIAYEVGFNDPAWFRRLFFRRCAMTPGAYRKLKSGGHVNTE